MDVTDNGIKSSIRDTVADKTAKRVAKQARDAEARQEREEGIFNNKLVVERDVSGLYYVRWAEGGVLPEVLQTKFTSIRKIEDVVRVKYGSVEILAKP